jgi:hypothetical protein
MNKQDLWPKEGKLKKALLILCIVIAGALLITLAEEKLTIKLPRFVTYLIAFSCIGIWLYQPAKKQNN